MSVIDDLMSKVIDLDEKEKEETILFLAEALINDNYEFLKRISPKVQMIVLPFLSNLVLEILSNTKTEMMEKISEDKGGEKDGTGTRLKDNKERGTRY